MKGSTPAECFEAWKACSRGRPCDYTGLSYEQLRGGSGIQWPCNALAPDGTERLYQDGVFPTSPDVCEDFGHDLRTGATLSEAEFRALAAGGARSSRRRSGRRPTSGQAPSTRWR